MNAEQQAQLQAQQGWDREQVQAVLQEELTGQFEWLKFDRSDERVRGEISATLRIAQTFGFDRTSMREQAKRDSGFAS